jgi:hypothetical protein
MIRAGTKLLLRGIGLLILLVGLGALILGAALAWRIVRHPDAFAPFWQALSTHERVRFLSYPVVIPAMVAGAAGLVLLRPWGRVLTLAVCVYEAAMELVELGCAPASDPLIRFLLLAAVIILLAVLRVPPPDQASPGDDHA